MSSPSEADDKCSICLGKIELGQGEAIFTAECSHTFHFTCISTNIEHKNYTCPLCRAKWKNLPQVRQNRNPSNNAPNTTSLEGFFRNPFHVAHQPNPSYTLPIFRQLDSFEELRFSLRSSPLSSSSSLPDVSVRATPERAAVSASESIARFSVLVQTKAPSLPPEETDDPNLRSRRAPIDLVMVLDTSGSMQGDKLTLLKRAVNFVIDNLGPSDRLSVVSFSTSAHIMFPLSSVGDQVTRELAKNAVNRLHAEGDTNIFKGLEKAVEALAEAHGGQNRVSSIMLLSDGRDTCHGYEFFSNTSGSYLYLMPGSIRRCNRETGTLLPVHAFGLGSGHDPLAMHAIANESGGTFSFVESNETIRDAFASCIGGLLSVVVQGLRLVLKSASPGVEIKSIPLGRYAGRISGRGSEGAIDVGDLYADEEKRFLIDLSVPKLPNAEERKTSLLNIVCSYLDAVSKEAKTVGIGPVEITRPEEPAPQESDVNPRVDWERTRLNALRSIAEAQRTAEEGDLRGARRLLSDIRATILDSDSWREGDDVARSLEAEMRETELRMGSAGLYERGGRAYTLSCMSSHESQRATTSGSGSWWRLHDSSDAQYGFEVSGD